MKEGVFDIEYRETLRGISSSECGVIEVFINDQRDTSPLESHKYYHRVDVNTKTVYEDMHGSLPKIVAATVLWSGCKEIVVCLSKGSSIRSYDVLEHVLATVCLSLGANIDLMNRKWVVCSLAGGQHQEHIKDVVEKVRKVYAGRLLALFPANVATPDMLCTKFAEVFSKAGANVSILTEKELQEQGFGLIMGIGNSAVNPPRMLVVRRQGSQTKSRRHIGVVGKGVTFDSGGLAIKPFKSMYDMKFDKIGAIYSAMVLLYFLENREFDNVEFTGVFPFVENAVSHKALRPGDVITSYSGKTVEISNPDAEGRLILADAFSYIQKFKIDFLFDLATLTGHASDISCWHSGMFFTRDQKLAEKVEKLGENIGERVLAMPFWKDHARLLKSPVADIVNSPKKCSDSTVAAMFLAEFVDLKLKWIHLDLAHETDGEIPKGNGIRIAIRTIEELCKKK